MSRSLMCDRSCLFRSCRTIPTPLLWIQLSCTGIGVDRCESFGNGNTFFDRGYVGIAVWLILGGVLVTIGFVCGCRMKDVWFLFL
nr:hypothetical protein Q903MT_gene1206 [Picea sitchensis]